MVEWARLPGTFLDAMRRRGLALVLWLVMLPGTALAHPHAWIDLRMEVQFDDDGHITALKQSWELDTLYSLVVLEQIQVEGVGDTLDEKLENFGQEMIREASGYNYMTHLRSAGMPVAVRPVQDYTLEKVDNRLRLSFVLPLLQPIDPRLTPLSYAVFDPTFYIEITHDDNGVQLQGGSADCDYAIEPPDPTDEMRERAVMIDETGEVDEDLGRHFAELAEIRCAPPS